MRIVALEREIAEFEFEDRPHLGVQFHHRQRTRIAGQLLARLLEMIRVEMRVAEGVDEFAGTKIADLRDHHRQERIRGDVERNAEKDVRAALVHLAGQPPVGDVELEQRVARLQRHLVEIADVPRADDEPARVGLAPDLRDHVRDLIDVPPIRRRPRAPLIAVHRPELAVRIRPFIPDRDLVLVEKTDVRLPGEKPQQLVDDRAQMHLLRRQQRKPALELEAQLMPEHAQRARARAIRFRSAVVEDVANEREVLLHGEIVIGTLRPLMEYRSETLYIGNVATTELAERFGTPLYVYDAGVIRGQIENVREAFKQLPFRPFYAMKANSNLSILRLVREAGFGCDAVSPGEIFLAMRAGFTPEEIWFTCSNVSDDDLRAIPDPRIVVNVNSVSEIDRCLALDLKNPLALRINPDVGAGHHADVVTAGESVKFGIDLAEVGIARMLVEDS